MKSRTDSTGLGSDIRLWPVFTVLLLAVLIPSSAVLWFMIRAVGNERLAVRQKLTEIYAGELRQIGRSVQEHLVVKVKNLAAAESASSAGKVFAKLVTSGICDSVVIRDEQGHVRYPQPAVLQVEPPWNKLPLAVEAQRAEYELENLDSAAKLYGRIVSTSRDTSVICNAIVGRIRCLARLGQAKKARSELLSMLEDDRFAHAVDARGRYILPNAQLLGLEVVIDPTTDQYATTAKQLIANLNDYDRYQMPSSQRRFLMDRVLKLMGSGAVFPTYWAEEAAAEYIVGDLILAEKGPLKLTSLAGVNQIASPSGRTIGLYRQGRLAAEMDSFIEANMPLAGATIKVLAPSAQDGPVRPFLTLPIGGALWDWQLAVYLTGSDPFTAAAHRHIAIYFWTGSLSVITVLLGSVLVASFISRQIRLTQLKNDLTATVSHELKTPLASMRVLVDTLLAGKVSDADMSREYFEMISRENHRLSRMIDNFLAFSRMERKRHAFEFEKLEVGQLIETAIEFTGDRFTGLGCKLSVVIAPDLPPVWADGDAMVTVLLNLLDNAHKYTGDHKRVEICAACGQGDAVAISVSDNGVGLSGRSLRRVFGKFYQVDRRLSRTVGGCGLGLSIVKFIVTAHGGTVSASSQLGKGSTFTVSLPAADSVPAARVLRRNGQANGK